MLPPADDNLATIRQLPGQTLEIELPALRLRVLGGADAGRSEDLSLDLVRLGSASDNDVVLGDATISRHHAELTRSGDQLNLRDLDSTNGTWVEGVRIRDAFLTPGQAFRLGDTELTVEPRRSLRAGVPGDGHRFGSLVGSTPAMRRLYSLIRAIAETHASVLLQGESGTGKELVAQAIHEHSGRTGTLVPFDAASTDPEMIRSDLFGHTRGAFTGAEGPRQGAFRRAHGGTLFLDEIGELPLSLQARLLRVLETRCVTPLGADDAVPVDVRIVAATHRDLAAMAAEGTFRLDLYHRLAVVPVALPPLRERAADIPLLVQHLGEGLGISITLTPEAEAALRAHPWPGNVRELRNVIERATALGGGRPLRPDDLLLSPGAEVSAPAGPGPAPRKPAARIAELERDAIEAALARNGGNKTATARELGISISTLQRRLRSYKAS